MTKTRNKVWEEMLKAECDAAVLDPEGVTTSMLAFDIDEQPLASTVRLTERTDLPVSELPKPEPRHVPLWVRLRLMWHKQIVRDLHP